LHKQQGKEQLIDLKGEDIMKQLNLYEENGFSEKAFKKLLVHDSPYFKILNFNFKAGQELPVHNHDIEGQLSLVIIEGEGEFLGQGDTVLPAKAGDVVICDIAEPHGLRAKTDLRLLVTIAPPI
jgi:quercetin dioxygenase-like cupin family protein